ncbi:MAG TPA: EutN/CcmL family microcompartment protein [Spirochaetota bacterium]|nr:EutN/CcmL family microcompartment protein [Spirochaetota bacterium]
MKLGRVMGSVVCSQKDPSFEGVTLLLVQPLDEQKKPIGDMIAACDTVQAGPGDLVFFEGGREAAMALPNAFNPSDASVLGIVDDVEVQA